MFGIFWFCFLFIIFFFIFFVFFQTRDSTYLVFQLVYRDVFVRLQFVCFHQCDILTKNKRLHVLFFSGVGGITPLGQRFSFLSASIPLPSVLFIALKYVFSMIAVSWI